jgi:hypothetical protein
VLRQLHDPAGLPRIIPSILQEARKTNEWVWTQETKRKGNYACEEYRTPVSRNLDELSHYTEPFPFTLREFKKTEQRTILHEGHKFFRMKYDDGHLNDTKNRISEHCDSSNAIRTRR